jgi:hypothetical protein
MSQWHGKTKPMGYSFEIPIGVMGFGLYTKSRIPKTGGHKVTHPTLKYHFFAYIRVILAYYAFRF